MIRGEIQAENQETFTSEALKINHSPCASVFFSEFRGVFIIINMMAIGELEKLLANFQLMSTAHGLRVIRPSWLGDEEYFVLIINMLVVISFFGALHQFCFEADKREINTIERYLARKTLDLFLMISEDQLFYDPDALIKLSLEIASQVSIGLEKSETKKITSFEALTKIRWIQEEIKKLDKQLDLLQDHASQLRPLFVFFNSEPKDAKGKRLLEFCKEFFNFATSMYELQSQFAQKIFVASLIYCAKTRMISFVESKKLQLTIEEEHFEEAMKLQAIINAKIQSSRFNNQNAHSDL